MLFEKLECNQKVVHTPAPSFTNTFSPASVSATPSVENFGDMDDDMDDDLNAFLKLNEEERDTWGTSNNALSAGFNGKSFRKFERVSWV